MNKLAVLYYDEVVRLDPDQISELYCQLGEIGAENVICRAMEELAVRLAELLPLFRDADYERLGKTARSLVGIADQIGMYAVARIARDVSTCAQNKDMAALSATMSRLNRVADRSLAAIWDMRDMSI